MCACVVCVSLSLSLNSCPGMVMLGFIGCVRAWGSQLQMLGKCWGLFRGCRYVVGDVGRLLFIIYLLVEINTRNVTMCESCLAGFVFLL